MNRWLAIFCISFLVFANTLSYPFVHDEVVFIVQNKDISRWNDLAGIFSPPTSSTGIAGANTYYRPLLELLYRLQYQCFGLNPAGWHLFNILAHGINGLLVYRLLLLLGMGGSVSFAVALLFVAHPVQSEAVACVAGVSNLLMALLVLLTLIFYLKDKWLSSLLCFILALLTKEQSLIAVPLILLIDWYRGRSLARCMPFCAVALCFLALRQVLTQSNLLAVILASPGELKLRLLAIGQVLATDIRILLFPYDLHYYRSTDILAANVWWWAVLIGGGFLIAKLGRLARFGGLWFVLTLLPVLNIMPLINEYSLILTADHFLYLPLLGIMIILGVTASRVTGIIPALARIAKQPAYFLALVCILGGLTIYQNTFWRNEVALFERTMAHEQNFGRGHLLLAKAYYFDQRYIDANRHFDRAYAILNGYRAKAVGDAPKMFYAGLMKETLFDWAHSLENLGTLEEAKQKYLSATAIDPKDPVLWDNLGVLCLRMADPVQAGVYFQKAKDLIRR